MLEFRRAKAEDRERILEISSTIWEGEDYLPMIFDSWVADSHGEFTVAEIDKRLVGCAKYSRYNDKEAWLEGIRGDKKYSGKGFGEKMTEYYIRKAQEEKLDCLKLSTFIDNYQSIHIIEKLGFKKDGYFTFFYREIKEEETILPADNIINLLSTASVWQFIEDSRYKMMSNGYISFGWKFYILDYELVDALVKEKRVYGVLKDGRISAVMIIGDEPTDPKGISISFVDGKKEDVGSLIRYAAYYGQKQKSRFVSVMSVLDEDTIDKLEEEGYRSIADKPRAVNVFVYKYKL